MIVLQVRLEPLDETAAGRLRSIVAEAFGPAIRVQPGFRSAQLLRAVPSGHETSDGAVVPLILVLCFDDEAQRVAWVATPEHAAVWPQVREQCADISPVHYEVLERQEP